MSNVFWLNACEASGDLHGAMLIDEIRALVPDARFMGVGGPAMRERGFEAVARSEELSLMGLVEVLAHLPRVLGIISRVKKRLAEIRPRALVLIDAPDFNFRLLDHAKAHDIPAYYYVSPQLWAWRPGRAKILARTVRDVICILPFEQEFYARQGMRVSYVGHPLVDAVSDPKLASVVRRENRLLILPGSRGREIRELAPIFAEAARRLRAERPGLEVAVIPAPGRDPAEVLDHFVGAGGFGELVLPAGPTRLDRYALMKSCRCALAASGTVALELALLGTPAAVAYKLSPLTYAVGRLVVKVPFMSLPNLILGREVFPELLQDKVTPEALAGAVRPWLPGQDNAEDRYEQTSAALAELAGLLGPPGAAGRAAEIVVSGKSWGGTG